jgi:dephospho-CoA kinase
MITIGITGTIGAGKGTIVDYLEAKGFRHYSAREFIVAEIKRRGMPVNRDSMTIVADDFRATHAPSYIIESLYDKASVAGVDAIIESIRATGEVKAMKSKPGFYLFAVDADPKIRYERIRSRASATDAVSFEKFLADERREINPADPTRGDLLGCIELADFQITNSGTIEELRRQVDDILAEIGKEQSADHA